MRLDLEGLTASGSGEDLGEPVQLEGHFRVPSQDVPEPFVGEPDFVSVLVGEAPHAGLHHQIPYRKVYRDRA